MNDLKGKTVIITGGSRGIGRACCLAFAKEGANIVFTYNKSKDKAQALEKELGKNCLCLQLDIGDYDGCRKVIEETLKKFGKLDVLINNAGVTAAKALMMMTPQEWKEVIDTDLGGVFNMTRSAITTLLKQKSGSIVNISSVAGIVGLARQSHYSAAKAGIIGFSKSLAREVAEYGIRVNTVCPGYIETDMVSGLRDDIKKQILDYIPTKKFGNVDDVAQLCVFLASDKASYMTGEVVKVDGGLAI